MPVMPVKLAGWRMEPPVSVPVAAGTRPAATAAALPPEEPPGTRLKSQGFFAGKKAEFALDGERYAHWLKHGAQPSETLASLVRRFKAGAAAPAKTAKA